ncbi:tetratricopeptide repeat protein [Leucobacter viscericola]|uniref:Tetratricopeptide repeat protein n=1 Tax=Leucobacter viscericola TaxID=2714935 RepID=A0A6G7XE78_9MICO|nr:tetratricopeptide repeat protein [Leucobacter viscericola]QIK62812.1 tetratricopeptide repeat protein [Leucobacter viscericola]
MGESLNWQERIDAVWNDSEASADEVIARITELVSELPADDPRGPFELGGAYDSAGFEAEAAGHYARAVELGLSGSARAELDIQYASTLRNLGRADEAVAMLRDSQRDPALGASPEAFLALALHSSGKPDDALAVALEALIPFLPRYERSLRGYVSELRTN